MPDLKSWPFCLVTVCARASPRVIMHPEVIAAFTRGGRDPRYLPTWAAILFAARAPQLSYIPMQWKREWRHSPVDYVIIAVSDGLDQLPADFDHFEIGLILSFTRHCFLCLFSLKLQHQDIMCRTVWNQSYFMMIIWRQDSFGVIHQCFFVLKGNRSSNSSWAVL